MRGNTYKASYKTELESNPLIGDWVLGMMQKGRKYDLGILITEEKLELKRNNEVLGDVDLNETADVVQQQLEDLMTKHPIDSKK